MLSFFTTRHKRTRDQLTVTRVTRSNLEAAPSRTARPHPVINIRPAADDSLGGFVDGYVQPDTGFRDDEGPEAGTAFHNFDFNAGGLPEQLLQEEAPSAFDSIRAQMHAEYWKSLPANIVMFQGRKEATKVSLLAAIAAHGSHCPRCNNMDLHTQEPAVSVLWVGASYRFELAVPRRHCCVCQHSFSLKPLQLGCLPATAVQGWDLTKVVFGGRPMWFDLQLLQAVDTEMCVIKRQSMDRRCDVLMRAHEHSGCSDVALNYDTLRKRLGEVVREYGYLMAAHADLHSLGVSKYPQGLLSDCGGCWEAAQPADEGGGQPLHSVNIDFNFKLNHLTRADASGDIWDVGSKSPPFSRFFIQDDEMLQHLRDPQSTLLPDDGRLQCSDFKADEILGRTPGGKNDITSLGVCLCRHGHIGFLMNSVTGERHAYATLFVKAILGCISMLLFVWYDINCRWAPSFLKWLALQGARLRERAAKLQFPLPRMHYYAHRAECQQEFGHVQMQQAGRGNGEPHEIFNAQFGPLGRTTMYMSRLNRQARLERAALFYTEQRALQLPALLMRMQMRACTALEDSKAAAEKARIQLQRKGLSDAQIQTDLQRLLASTGSSPAAMSWQAELARCQLMLHKAGLADGDTSTPALLLLFEDPAFAKLAPNSTQVKRARSRLQQLMASHSAELAGMDLAVASIDFKVFLAAFVTYKVNSLQEELAAKAIQYAHLQALMPNLSERSVEQAKIMKAISRVASVMDSKAVALQSWLSGDYVDALLLPESFARLKEGCSQWDLKSFHRGVFPWQPSQAEMEGRSVIELLTDLHLRVCEYQRAQEELGLVQKEKDSALRLYTRQAAALGEAHAAASEAAHLSSAVHEASSLEEHIQHQQDVKTAKMQEGITVVLQQKLQSIRALHAHAQRAFLLPLGHVMAESTLHGAALPYLDGDEQAPSDSDEE